MVKIKLPLVTDTEISNLDFQDLPGELSHSLLTPLSGRIIIKTEHMF